MLDAFARNWWALVVRGVVAVLFGIFAIIWPELTLAALVLTFGAFVLIDGVFNMVAAWNARSHYNQWWVGLMEGLLGITVGIATFVWPEITGLTLLYLIAIWAIVTGFLELVAAYDLRKIIENEWLLGLSGLASVLFGFALITFPISGALVVAWLIGAYAILFGGTLIALGFTLHNYPDALVTAREQAS